MRPGAARGRALMFTSAIAFGLAAMLARLAAGRGMGGGQVAIVRFAVGLAGVVALFRLHPGTFRPSRWGLLAARGLLGGVAVLLYFVSLARVSAGEATLLNNVYPIFAVLLSLFTLGERPTAHLFLALVVAGAGVWLVLGGGGISIQLGVGELCGLGSALAAAVAVTSIRALRASVNAPTIFFAFSVGGLLVAAPLGFAPWPADPWAWAAALATGLASGVAQITMTEAYGALSVAEAALWQQLTPIAAYLWALIIGEPFGRTTLVGVLLGIGGVLYGSLLGHRPGVVRQPRAAAPALSVDDR